MPAKYSQLIKAVDGKHKFQMIFYDAARKRIKTTSFGAKGYEDYTVHNDKVRQQSYIARHKATENWDDPYTSGACARFLLWNKTTLSASYKDFRNRFGFQLY